MEWAFKGTAVCFSSGLKDRRGFEGIKRAGHMFLFIPLTPVFSSLLLCHILHSATLTISVH